MTNTQFSLRDRVHSDDLKHLYHAWEQAEDGQDINRAHIDACVRLGFMEKAGRRRWIFTPTGEDAAREIESLWRNGMFDPLTGIMNNGPATAQANFSNEGEGR